MKYRKKPVEIEAFQYDGDFQNREGKFYIPLWAIKAYKEGILFFDGPTLKIKTLTGDITASVNDFIIQGIDGEIYSCKPDIFEKTYLKGSKMKYRKKPIIIEAFRFMIDATAPDWFMDRVSDNIIITHQDGTCDINTLKGTMRADKGDYIVLDVNEEVYPCKPDVFIKTYEEIK